MFIKFKVKQYVENLGGKDPEDRWTRDSTASTVWVECAKLCKEYRYDTLPVDFDVKPGDTIYLLYALYSTADSFGSDSGNYELLEVHQHIDKARLRENYYKNSKDYSLPWIGYFDSLDELRIEEFVVQDFEEE